MDVGVRIEIMARLVGFGIGVIQISFCAALPNQADRLVPMQIAPFGVLQQRPLGRHGPAIAAACVVGPRLPNGWGLGCPAGWVATAPLRGTGGPPLKKKKKTVEKQPQPAAVNSATQSFGELLGEPLELLPRAPLEGKRLWQNWDLELLTPTSKPCSKPCTRPNALPSLAELSALP